MKAFLIISVIAYLTLTFGGGTAALLATIQIYLTWGREPPEILSAAIVNTAAIFAATTFIGVLDMFMTLWTLLKTREWEDEARKERLKEREENRLERAEERERREQERAADQQRQEKALEETRLERAAERERQEKALEESRLTREAEQQRQEKALEESRLAREAERERLAQERAAERERLAQERAADQQRQEKALAESRLAREAEQQRWEREFELRQAESQARMQVFEQESRAFQQQVLDRLDAEQAQRDLMTTRVLDLLEHITHRSNGRGGNDNGNGSNGDRPTDADADASPDAPEGQP